MKHNYSYAATLEAARKPGWAVEDVLGDRRLDFDRPFLPEGLARVGALSFLPPEERLVLNQVRGNEYLTMFGLVEEFILPFVMDHVRKQLDADDVQIRALLQFAGEEAKHMHLFKEFRRTFERGFGTRCEGIGPAKAIAEKVLSYPPLSVALAILQIEWMSQRHFIESVRDDKGIDPLFHSLLRHHWMEESRHARLDTLMVEAIGATLSKEEIARGFEGYLEIGGVLDAGLGEQSRLNLESLERASGRRLSIEETKGAMEAQHRALRWTYLGSGMTHPNFLATLESIDPALRAKVEAVAPTFS